MRVLADENVPGPVIRSLRERGHDVLSDKEISRGTSDSALLERAQAEERLLVTLDKDFAELAFRFGLSAVSGVVLFRLYGSDSESDNARTLTVLESRHDWAGHFSVVTHDRIRMRLLPPAGTTEPTKRTEP